MTSARDELFDAAVNRATDYALRLGLPFDDPAKLHAGLELWYLKTRFAYRAPFEAVLKVLALRPSEPKPVWRGGREGAWHRAPSD